MGDGEGAVGALGNDLAAALGLELQLGAAAFSSPQKATGHDGLDGCFNRLGSFFWVPLE